MDTLTCYLYAGRFVWQGELPPERVEAILTYLRTGAASGRLLELPQEADKDGTICCAYVSWAAVQALEVFPTDGQPAPS